MTDPADDADVARQLDRLRAVRATHWPGEVERSLAQLALASDFAIETLLRQPALLDALRAGRAATGNAAGSRRREPQPNGPRCCADIVPPNPRA